QIHQVRWELRRPSRLERRQTCMCQWRGAGRVSRASARMTWPTTTRTPVVVRRDSVEESCSYGKREPAKSVNKFVVGGRNKQPTR
ncbi:hypothetical protein BDZ89DRAFT_1065835, partial [Hymenopellis radicata]